MKALLLNRILLVLAFAGLFVAGVLSLGHLMDVSVPCGGSNECQVVAQHPASKLFGIPVAYLGFLTYVGLALIAALRAIKGMIGVEKLIFAGYGLSAIGTVFSLYLQYQSFSVIHAKCMWCIASAAIMVLTLILHAVLAQAAEEPRPVVGPVEGEAAAYPRVSQVPGRSGALDKALIFGLPVAVLAGLGIMSAVIKDSGEGGVKADANPFTPEIYRQLLADKPHTLGPESAPITVIEFADLQCGACQSTSPRLKAFTDQMNGKVRMVFRHFPLVQKHEWAMPAAAVSEYAAEKGKFWELIMAVMGLGRELGSADELYDLAEMVGLDRKDLEKRLSNDQDKAYGEVLKDMEWADKLGIQLTPTFFIVTEGGKDVEIATSGNIFQKLQEEKYKKYLNG